MGELAGRVYWQVLVVRCQLGERAAFAELVTALQPRLRAFLHKLLAPDGAAAAAAADDVAQDVWMDVFRDLADLHEPAAFLPWFYRIAHNRAFRMLRRSRPNLAPIEAADEAIEQDEADEFNAEDAAGVHAALGRLSGEQREVLVLRFMEAMSYQEIAAVVGCPVGTVRSRIHNAKSALRRAILESARQ